VSGGIARTNVNSSLRVDEPLIGIQRRRMAFENTWRNRSKKGMHLLTGEPVAMARLRYLDQPAIIDPHLQYQKGICMLSMAG
jgi:hypothetical protein